MIDWSQVKEGDKIILTLPVTIKTIGFHNKHVWVRTDDWSRHEFAVPADAPNTSYVLANETEDTK